YRSLAQQTVDLCLRRLKKKQVNSVTATTPLPGAMGSSESFPEKIQRDPRLPANSIERLWRVYGSRSHDGVKTAREKPELLEIFDDETGAIAAEVVFSFKKEMARTLSDCLLRRTMVGLNSTCGLNAVEAAARIGKVKLGWTEDRAREEIQSYKHDASRFILS